MRSIPGTLLPTPGTGGIDALRRFVCLLRRDVLVPEYLPATLRTLFSESDSFRSEIASPLDELDATVHATRSFEPQSAERDVFAFVYT